MRIQELNDRIAKRESFLVANDGQFLGILSLNKFNPESISNDFGLYGSRFSTTSIKNQFSTYGSPYSSLSPYNSYTSTPPIIYLKGNKVGVLSVNPFLYGSVNPYELDNWMKMHNLFF
jgi:hypothetical protein